MYTYKILKNLQIMLETQGILEQDKKPAHAGSITMKRKKEEGERVGGGNRK